MSQIFTGLGLGLENSSWSQLGGYGPKGSALFGQGGGALYVNAATGNLVYQQRDGFLANNGLGLDLFESYNSQGEGGKSWRFNLESSLSFEGAANTPGSIIKRTGEDGHVSTFTFDARFNIYVATDGSTARLSLQDGAWTYTKGTGDVSAIYNLKGQLTAFKDQDGHKLEVHYEAGQLTRITDAQGTQTVTWHLLAGRLTDINIESQGEVIQHIHYEYDPRGRLSLRRQDLGDGKTYWTSYAYEGESNLINTISQSDGTSIHMSYDKEGRLRRLTDGEGRSTTYDYFNGKTTITNDLGEAWTYYYDSEARLTALEGPEGFKRSYHYDGKHLSEVIEGNQVTRLFYNEAGDLIRKESASGETIIYTYDKDHHLLSETHHASLEGNASPVVPKTTRFVYDEKGHLRFEIKADNTVVEYTYDANGRIKSKRVYLKSEYTANDKNTLKDLLEWKSKQDLIATSLSNYHYDWRGQLLDELHFTTLDAKGEGILTQDTQKTYWLYDAKGLLIEKSLMTEKGLSTTHYLYDALGRLIQTTDNQGHQKHITYDDAHQRILSEDASGLQTLSIYDKSGLLISEEQLTKTKTYGTTTYQYDKAGRLIAKTAADGKTTYLFYDHQGRIEAEVNETGQVTSYAYDEHGHCIERRLYEKHLNTKTWQDIPLFERVLPEASLNDHIEQSLYNNLGQKIYDIGSEGAVIGYVYDSEGHLLQKRAFATRVQHQVGLTLNTFKPEESPKDRLITYYYDALGRLIGEIGPEGSATGYTYDKEGHLTETRRFKTKTNQNLTLKWANDRPTETSLDIRQYSLYNKAGLKIADIDAGAFLTEYSYNEEGLLINKRAYYLKVDESLLSIKDQTLEALRPETHANDHETHFRYNDLNQLIEEEASGLITTYRYDESGLLIQKSAYDKRSKETRAEKYRYDALGRIMAALNALGVALLNKTNPEDSKAIEDLWKTHSISYTYDMAGRLTSKSNGKDTTHYLYNDQGQLTYTLSAEGAITETRYNTFNQIESITRYAKRFQGEPNKVDTKTLDALLPTLKEADKDEITHYTYNTLGQITCVQKGKEGALSTTYNTFGEIITETKASEQNDIITLYDYDKRGLLLTREVDLLGRHSTTKAEYDIFGRLIKSWDANNNLTLHSFNRKSEEIATVDAKGHVFTKSYDAYGRMLTSSKEEIRYEYQDQEASVTLAREGISTKITTTYNTFGDKVSIIDGNNAKTTYQYNEKGELIHIDAPENLSTTYAYDEQGHLLLETHEGGQSIRFTYDAEGRVLSKIQDPDGLAITSTYTYDAIGRVLSIEEKGILTHLSYDDRGKLIKRTIDPEGLALTTTYQYSKTGLLLRETKLNPSAKDQVMAYTWDGQGLCLSKTRDPDGLALTTSYRYDKNGNLIQEINANNNSKYFVYDAQNQCHYSINAKGVVSENFYDAKGNNLRTTVYKNPINIPSPLDETTVAKLTIPTNEDQHQFFAYDKQARLTLSFDSLGNPTSYQYDDNNNLIAKTQYADSTPLSDLLAGRRNTPEDKGASRTTRFVYDSAKRLSFVLEEGGRVKESVYGKDNQLIEERRYANRLSEIDLQGDYSFAHLKALSQKNNDKDEVKRYHYDKAGRLTMEVNGKGEVSCYQYDKGGNLAKCTRLSNRLSPQALQTADWFNKLTSNASDRESTSVFDAAGRERYRISPTGRVVERQYDAVGNIVLEITHSSALQAPKEDITLEALETFFKEDKEAHSKNHHYDALGRLTETSENSSHKTTYTYDNLDNVSTKTDANNTTWTYHYDKANQLIETISPQTTIATYKDGKWVEETRQIITETQYDSFGNIISLIKDKEGMHQLTNYRYDAKNQLLETSIPGTPVNAAANAQSSERQERLQTVKETNTYNAFGEVISREDKAGNKSYFAYDKEGKLRYTIDKENALTGYRYDTLGNLTEKTRFTEKLVNLKDHDLDSIARALKTGTSDRHEWYFYDNANRLIQTKKDEVLSYNGTTHSYQKESPLTTLDYNAFGEEITRTVKISQEDLAISRSYYNKEGLLSAKLDAENYLTTYEYNIFGAMTEETQYANKSPIADTEKYQLPEKSTKDRTVMFEYDAFNQLIKKTLKNVTYQQLEKSNHYETITSDLSSTYQYDALGHLTKTTDALGNTVFAYYDNLGQLTAKIGEKTDKGRAATTYTYDALGQLVIAHRYAKGALAANETDYTLGSATDEDIIEKNHYNSQGELVQSENGMQHAIYYSYDENGNLARTWQTLTKLDGSKTIEDKRYLYDKENRLISTQTLKDNGERKTDDATYNVFGEVTAKGINQHFTQHTTYDQLGRVRLSNGEGHYQIYLYDLSDNLTQVLTSSNAFGEEYDERGIDLSDSYYENKIDYNEYTLRIDLHHIDNLYDKLGRLTGRIEDATISTIDKYSGMPLKRVKESTTKDRWGNILSHTNKAEQTTIYEYNAFDEVIKQRLPEVDAVNEKGIKTKIKPEIYYAYNALGQAIAMTDANGHTKATRLDMEGNVLEEIDAKGNTRQKRYNLLGQLEASIDEKGSLTSYTYDQENRLIAIQTAHTSTRYQYDEAGQLLAQIDAKGNQTTYSYDVLGNQIEKQEKTGEKTTYEYDDAGRKTKETDALGNTQTWKYDPNGRLIFHKDLGNHETRYTYNQNGLLLKEESTSGKDISYHYYTDGKLAQYVDNTRKQVVNYGYDDEGRLTYKESGAIEAWTVERDYYQYDNQGRLVQVRRKNPSDESNNYPERDKALLEVNYDYDAVGNIRDTKVELNYINGKPVTEENYFLYDENDRMVLNKGQLVDGSIIINNQGSEITYDERGNLTEATVFEGGQKVTYSYRYNAENQLEHTRRNNIDFKNTRYDELGNVLEEDLFNNNGNITERHGMLYDKGRLTGQITRDKDGHDLSSSRYLYDEVGNLSELKTTVNDSIKGPGYIETHKYTQTLWEGYQQQKDEVTLEMSGANTTHGESLRIYDANGQLQEVKDRQNGDLGNSVTYLSSSIDGVRSRKDKTGETSYLNIAGKTIGDLHIDKEGKQHLELYAGFTPTGKPETETASPFEIKSPIVSKKLQESGPKNDGTLPNSPQDNLGAYTLQAGDTLEGIARQVYGDASLWYLIADANGLTSKDEHAGEKGGSMHIGQRINIPSTSAQHHTSNTQKVMTANDWMGNTSATAAPIMLPPPKPRKRHINPWKVISTIAMTAVAVLVTAYTAGALGLLVQGSGFLGITGIADTLGAGLGFLGSSTLGATMTGVVGFAAGFIGSLAGQGVANLCHLQKGIDLKSALITGLVTGATAGITRGLHQNSTYSHIKDTLSKSQSLFNTSNAIDMMERDVIAQGIHMTQGQKKIDWLDVLISTASAGIIGNSKVERINQTIENSLGKVGPIVTQELQALTIAGTTAAITKTKLDAESIIVATLGNSIGTQIANGSFTQPEGYSAIPEAEASSDDQFGLDNLTSSVEYERDNTNREALYANSSNSETTSLNGPLNLEVTEYIPGYYQEHSYKEIQNAGKPRNGFWGVVETAGNIAHSILDAINPIKQAERTWSHANQSVRSFRTGHYFDGIVSTAQTALDVLYFVPAVGLVSREVQYGVRGVSAVGSKLGALWSKTFTPSTSENFVYRALTEQDLASAQLGLGIHAKAPNGKWSAADHVANFSQRHGGTAKTHSPWISTTKNINIAKSYNSGNGFARIDYSKITSETVEVWRTSPRVNGVDGLPYHRSIWAEEITVYRVIPYSAIIEIVGITP